MRITNLSVSIGIFPDQNPNTPCIEPVVLGPCLSFVPNLQSLRGIPSTWLIGNLYFSGCPRLPQLGLLAAPQPLSVSILALVLIACNQGGGPMDSRFFPNEQGSFSGHTHQPTSQSTCYSNGKPKHRPIIGTTPPSGRSGPHGDGRGEHGNANEPL